MIIIVYDPYVVISIYYCILSDLSGTLLYCWSFNYYLLYTTNHYIKA